MRAAYRGAWLGRALPIVPPLLTAVCFLPSLRNDFVRWDDPITVTDNPWFRGFSPAHLRWMFTTVTGGHYQPLSWLTLAVDHAAWGMEPVGYHLTSLLLHAANALLVYLVAADLLRRAGWTDELRVRVAAVAGALFFGIHPLRVESVVWVSERRDVLSGLFWLLAVLAYLRRHEHGGAGWTVVSLSSLLLSLLSKAWGMTLPLVLLVLDAYPLRRLGTARGRREALVEKIPWVALAVVGATLAFLAQRPIPAMKTLADHGVVARIAQAAYGLCFYVGKTLLPAGLSPLYLLELRLDPTRPRYVLAMIAVVAVTALLVAARRRWPWALAAWVAYVVIVSPVLGFVQTGPQLVADRYTYLACLPWAMLVAAAVARTWDAPLPATMRRLAAGAGIAAAATLAALTVRQIAVWHDTDALWERVLRLDPRCFIAYNNRGLLREGRGDEGGALADFNRALEIHPGYPLAWYNRGNARRAIGDVDGAIADLTIAIRLNPADPQAWNNRGWNREAKGDLRGAGADYEQALHVAPAEFQGRALILQNLARVRSALGAS